MIKLKHMLYESKTHEEILLDFLKEKINGTKFENKVFVAGGYVRDMVMGKKSKDIDITVALPNGGIDFANWITQETNCYKEGSNPVVYPTFGTAKFNLRRVNYMGVDIGGIDLESVMTRKEQYKDKSRKPETSFGTPYQDVERRDLTINSLLYDISNQKILDLTGKGLKDIKSKTIRTPIDADIIFKEDPLRMLRAIRFTVRYGWKLSEDMQKSLTKNASMLENISKERIQEELDKIILSDNAVDGVKFLMETNLMKYIIPEYYQMVGMQQNQYHEWDVYEHSLNVLKNSPKRLEVRLGALLHDIGKPATRSDIGGKISFHGHEKVSAEMAAKALKRLKYSTGIIDRVVAIVGGHMRAKDMGDESEKGSDKSLRKLMNDMGDHIEDLLDLIHADNVSHGSPGWKHNMEKQVDAIRQRLKTLGDFSEKALKMPVNGDDVMALLNIKPGRDVGVILSKFKDMFFEDPEKINSMSNIEIERLIKQIYSAITR